MPRKQLDSEPQQRQDQAPVRQRRWAPKVMTGCLTCRDRKLKCDETWPQCLRCLKSQRQCLRRVATKDGRKTRSNRNNGIRVLEATTMSVVPVAPWNPPQFVGSEDVRDILYILPFMTDAHYYIDGIKIAGREDHVYFGGAEIAAYVEFLPARVGYDACLDTALKSVASLFRDLNLNQTDPPVRDSVVKKSTMSTYIRGLELLQVALDDPRRSNTAEILCATELLAVFESIQCTNSQGVLEHIKGIAQLIQHRGCNQFQTDFDISLLTGQLPALLISAVYSCEPCFLDSDEWAQILESAVLEKRTDITDRYNFSLSYFVCAIPVVRVLLHCTPFVAQEVNDNSLSTDQKEEKRLTLLAEVTSLVEAATKTFEKIVRLKPITQDKTSYIYCAWTSFCALMQTALIFYKRFHVILGGPDAYQMETELQQIASDLLQLHSSGLGSFLAKRTASIVLPLSESLVETKDEWLAFARYCDQDISTTLKVAPTDMFLDWLRRTGYGSLQSPTKGNNSGGGEPNFITYLSPR